MRGICLSICLCALLACTKAPTDEVRPKKAVPDAATAPASPQAQHPPAPPEQVADSAQTGADRYLREAMDAAQHRYEAATAACAGQQVPDDCVSSATAALEQEQAAARLEHQRQLQELHQGG